MTGLKPSRSQLDSISKLLRAVVDISETSDSFATKRQLLLEHLVKQLDAKFAHWAWARGDFETDEFFVIAGCYYGYSQEQLAGLSRFFAGSEQSAELYQRLKAIMEASHRDDGGWIVNARDNLKDVIGQRENPIYQGMQRIGVEPWIQAGKFVSGNAFSAMVVARPIGSPHFDDLDTALLDFAFSNISWLHATSDDRVPQSMLAALSQRQALIAHLLITGLTRKKIAAQIDISPETVDHHIKAIFRHFDSHSATELAALFLKNQ